MSLHNYQLLLNYTGLELEAELAALETLSRSKVDGIVLMATNITEQHIQIIEKINVPVIVGKNMHNCIVYIMMITKLDLK